MLVCKNPSTAGLTAPRFRLQNINVMFSHVTQNANQNSVFMVTI